MPCNAGWWRVSRFDGTHELFCHVSCCRIMAFGDICMMKLIDTHCHLYGKDFVRDLEEVIQRAEREGLPVVNLKYLKSGWVKSDAGFCLAICSQE